MEINGIIVLSINKIVITKEAAITAEKGIIQSRTANMTPNYDVTLVENMVTNIGTVGHHFNIRSLAKMSVPAQQAPLLCRTHQVCVKRTLKLLV